MDTMDIKRIINEYNNQLYAHRLDNLDEMHQFPEGDNTAENKSGFFLGN